MKIRSILEILHDFENLRKFWPFLLKTLQISQYLIKIFQIFCGSSLTHRKYFHQISLILEDMEIYAAVHFKIIRFYTNNIFFTTMQTCAASQVKSWLWLFCIFQKSQVMTWLLDDLTWLFLKKMTFGASLRSGHGKISRKIHALSPLFFLLPYSKHVRVGSTHAYPYGSYSRNIIYLKIIYNHANFFLFWINQLL